MKRALLQLAILLCSLYGLQMAAFGIIRIVDHYCHRYVATPEGTTEATAREADKVSIATRISGAAMIPGLGVLPCLLYVCFDGLESTEIVISHDGWRYCRDMEVRATEHLVTRRRGDCLELVNPGSKDEVRFTLHRPGFNFADSGH